MDDIADDGWPSPDFTPGPHKHLHAIGVIALTFAQLERSIDDLYIAKAERLGMPRELSVLNYFGLDEERRLTALATLFSEENEPESSLRDHVNNLAKCFAWARDCRNKILHAEMHPITFYYSKQDLLFLTKRVSKKSAKTGYIDLDLLSIRKVAELMREYVARSAELSLYFRVRDVPQEKLEAKYLAFRELPTDLLELQPKIELRDFPDRA